MTGKPEILSFEDVRNGDYFKSTVGQNIIEYLDDFDIVSTIVEHDYIDKDYLIDYSLFHSRSFNAPERKTKRVHFFKGKSFSPEVFNDYLKTGNINWLDNSHYCGFSVIKPIPDENGNPFIGRTVLNPNHSNKTTEQHHYLTVPIKSSLFGFPLTTNGLPFQTQDTMVCSCATSSIWSSLYALREMFGVPIYSPYEVREIAVTTPSLSRSFPSTGLNVQQMINFYKLIDLDVEPIRIRDERSRVITDTKMIEVAIKAFLHCKLPIIATLTLIPNVGSEDYHAVVISGYKSDGNGTISEIFLHDDGVSPYSKATPIGDLSDWDNTWTDKYGYSEVHVDWLLVPIYTKVRLSFPIIYDLFNKLTVPNGFTSELLLTQVNDYKSFLLQQDIGDKQKILTTDLLHYVWIIRVSYLTYPIWDHVYDGTSVFPKEIATVEYL